MTDWCLLFAPLFKSHSQYVIWSACFWLWLNDTITVKTFKQSHSLTFSNDIALLRLSSDAVMTSYVGLANLPPFGEILPHNHPCYITGYGRTSSKSDALSLLILIIVNVKYAVTQYPAWFTQNKMLALYIVLQTRTSWMLTFLCWYSTVRASDVVIEGYVVEKLIKSI